MQPRDRPLDAGEGILLFTDGLTELVAPFSEVIASGGAHERPRPELFGSDGIAAVLAEHAGEEPEDVVRGAAEGGGDVHRRRTPRRSVHGGGERATGLAGALADRVPLTLGASCPLHGTARSPDRKAAGRTHCLT